MHGLPAPRFRVPPAPPPSARCHDHLSPCTEYSMPQRVVVTSTSLGIGTGSVLPSHGQAPSAVYEKLRCHLASSHMNCCARDFRTMQNSPSQPELGVNSHMPSQSWPMCAERQTSISSNSTLARPPTKRNPCQMSSFSMRECWLASLVTRHMWSASSRLPTLCAKLSSCVMTTSWKLEF